MSEPIIKVDEGARHFRLSLPRDGDIPEISVRVKVNDVGMIDIETEDGEPMFTFHRCCADYVDRIGRLIRQAARLEWNKRGTV